MNHVFRPRRVRTAGLSAAVVALWLLADPVMGGQGPERHKWWLSADVKAQISLSEPQSQELDAIFQTVAPSLRTNWEELERAEREVSRLMNEGTADETRVVAAIDRAEGARAALNRSRTLMLFRMYRVLTPEQRGKLSSYHQRRDQERRGRPDAAPR